MEWVTKSCNLNAVTISVSSIAKNIFGRLFRYLVDMCNNTLIDPTMKKVTSLVAFRGVPSGLKCLPWKVGGFNVKVV